MTTKSIKRTKVITHVRLIESSEKVKKKKYENKLETTKMRERGAYIDENIHGSPFKGFCEKRGEREERIMARILIILKLKIHKFF